MSPLEIIIGIILCVMGVFLVVSVLMQSSKDHRLSGSIAGGAETFFGKTKGKTIDATLNRLTMYVTIIFVVLVLVLYFVQPAFDPYAPVEDPNAVSGQLEDDVLAEGEQTETETETDVEAETETDAEPETDVETETEPETEPETETDTDEQ